MNQCYCTTPKTIGTSMAIITKIQIAAAILRWFFGLKKFIINLHAAFSGAK